MTLTVSQIETLLAHTVTLGFPPATELAYLAAERSSPIILVQPQGVVAQQFTKLAEELVRRISK
jgi:hypothetical protein